MGGIVAGDMFGYEGSIEGTGFEGEEEKRRVDLEAKLRRSARGELV